MFDTDNKNKKNLTKSDYYPCVDDSMSDKSN